MLGWSTMYVKKIYSYPQSEKLNIGLDKSFYKVLSTTFINVSSRINKSLKHI